MKIDNTTAIKTVVLVGGGSGGHTIPLIPISEELKKSDKNIKIVYIGQKKDRFGKILQTESSLVSDYYYVSAGKFRRYNGEKILKRILDIKTFLLNVRDFFFFLTGIIQSWRLLRRIKPQVVFTKGGYVCAPVGIAAGWLKIPIITHDSDAMVSLAHRLISRYATLHLTAMPKEYYKSYNQSITITVGVPVRKEFVEYDNEDKENYKLNLGYKKEDKILLIVGGGLGSKVINDAVVAISDQLLSSDYRIRIINVTGHNLYSATVQAYEHVLNESNLSKVKILDFTTDIYKYSGAADVIVTRAGATNLAEFAAQKRACIVVPNPLLAGGHQLKNAEALEKNNAVLICYEQELFENKFIESVNLLIDNKKKQEELSENLFKLYRVNASESISKIIVDIASRIK